MYWYRNKLKVLFLAAQSTDNIWNNTWIKGPYLFADSSPKHFLQK